MNREFPVPDLGEGIAEVEIVAWHVAPGDDVAENQLIVTVETDKSVVEMPSPFSGRVVALGGAVGDLLGVGSVLLTVEGEDLGHPKRVPEAGTWSWSGPDAADETTEGRSEGAASWGEPRRPLASPAVRRLAVERGLQLEDVRGTGPDGRVTREDVLAVASASTPEGAGAGRGTPGRVLQPVGSQLADQRVPLRGLRRQVARNTAASWRSVPHIIDYREVDATGLIAARAELKQRYPERASLITYLPFFIAAAAASLRRHPLMNCSFDEDAEEYVVHSQVHVGFATASDAGLLVPVVRNADTKSVPDLSIEISSLSARARARTSSPGELRGGTYTVTNYGSLGATMAAPIIRAPEVGIAGFGRVTDRVVAFKGVPTVRPTLVLSSVADHRLHDGDSLAGFTTTLVSLLETPAALT